MIRTYTMKNVKDWTRRTYEDLCDRLYEDRWTYEGDDATLTGDDRIIFKDMAIDDAIDRFGLSVTQTEKLAKFMEGLH